MSNLSQFFGGGAPRSVTNYTTGTGTFTPNAATKWLRITMAGGGGGGGGMGGGTTGWAMAGQTAQPVVYVVPVSGAMAYAVGAAGTAGAAGSAGGDGGNTTLGSLTAQGGLGGLGIPTGGASYGVPIAPRNGYPGGRGGNSAVNAGFAGSAGTAGFITIEEY